MTCSIELWLRYLAFLVARAIRFVAPGKILKSERLGRSLFSGHVRGREAGAKIYPSAFMINRKSENGISVNRVSLAPLRLLSELGRKSAADRSANQGQAYNFYGFAVFDGGLPSKVRLDDGYRLLPKGAPTRLNPFHADIRLPPDRNKDYYLFIATELVKNSTFVPTAFAARQTQSK